MSEPGQVRILCVDDERNVLKALRRLFLDEEHYDILTANSGPEGLDLLEEEPDVRLIISDYRMPGMTGVEFLKQVCEKWPNTVRIVLSGYADTAAVVEAINAGQIYKFIPKPWNDEELKGTVANALEHYELRFKNLALSEELTRKNEELERVNENLETLIEDRTTALELRNQVLSVAQDVLDVLPVAVVGFDPTGMIAQCNEECGRLFGMGPGEMLGYDRQEIFSPEINKALDGVAEQQSLAHTLILEDREYVMRVRPLDDRTPRGYVVAWVPCHCDEC